MPFPSSMPGQPDLGSANQGTKKRKRSEDKNYGNSANFTQQGTHEYLGQDVDEISASQRCTTLSRRDYMVGWICALPIEMAAAMAFLDNRHPSPPKIPNDSNTYCFGNIGTLNIVIACLPSGGYGTNNAATVASNMLRTFPEIQVRLIVGIGGGAPSKQDVRLGDVVVSDRVVQYDLGKTGADGRFEPIIRSYQPPQELLTATAKLQACHERQSSRIPSLLKDMLERNRDMSRYKHPAPLEDLLFASTYEHTEAGGDCSNCDQSMVLTRHDRANNLPKIHYGGIASANQVMKNGRRRDQLAQELDVLCFEMEAAGLMSERPFLVIRGICDYSDSHKNKSWQEYSAAVAAAYAKELICAMEMDGICQTRIISNQPPSGQISTQDRREMLLNSLRFDTMDSRRSTIKNPYSTTCRWILKHPTYEDWIDPEKYPQHNGFLWINGKPGAGKSTIMKHAHKSYADGNKAENTIVASFFFNARGDELEKSTAGMYRALVLQLFEKAKDLQEILDDLPSVPEKGNQCPEWTIDLLCEILSSAIARLGQRQFTCFIDALDECDEQSIQDMVHFFRELGREAYKNGTHLYICFASRHYPTIDIENGLNLVLEDEVGHGEDLAKYVQSHLKAGAGKNTDQIREQIQEKANGVFMWVVLVIPILNDEFRRGRIFAVKKKLAEIPKELGELFKQILMRDNTNMSDMLLCLQWILYAQRPLKREEFYFAMVAGLDPESDISGQWDREQITRADMDHFVVSSSKGLAELTKTKNPTVQFIHESVRDFLLKDDGLCQLWPELETDLYALSHDRLKQCCYNYLRADLSSYVSPAEGLPKASSPELKALRQDAIDKYPFMEYSARTLLYHANEAAVGIAQDNFLKDVYLMDWIKVSNLLERANTHRHMLTASLVYILAEKGLARLVETACHGGFSTEVTMERHRYPLFAALANGHQDTVQILLQQMTDSPIDVIAAQLDYSQKFSFDKEHTPFLWALERGHEDLAEVLLPPINFELLAMTHKQRTILSWAAEKGFERIVGLLLEDEWINIDDYDARTPLSWAAGQGHIAIVQRLLDKGANVSACRGFSNRATNSNFQKLYKPIMGQSIDTDAIYRVLDTTGMTSLHFAAKGGHEAIVRLLLDAGAEPGTRDIEGMTALHFAAKEGHEPVIPLLVDAGAEVDIQDVRGITAIYYAAAGGHEAVIRHLVNVGAKFDTQESLDMTTLQYAAAGGHEEVVRYLVGVGAKVDIQDTYGQTALQYAAIKGREAVVRLLVDVGADPNIQDASGDTALLKASRLGHEAIFLYLLDAGAETSFANFHNHTALSLAYEGGYHTMVHHLLVEKTDNHLLMASKCGHDPIVGLLLRNGRSVEVEDSDGRSPLSHAAERGHEATVQLLLEHGATIDALDRAGRTALSYAAAKRHAPVVRCLLGHNANAAARDVAGRTPLSWVVGTAEQACNARLRSRHQIPETPGPEWAFSNDDATHQYQAQLMIEEYGSERREEVCIEIVTKEKLPELVEIIQLLLPKTGDPHVEQSNGKTALMWVAEDGRDGIMRFLFRDTRLLRFWEVYSETEEMD